MQTVNGRACSRWAVATATAVVLSMALATGVQAAEPAEAAESAKATEATNPPVEGGQSAGPADMSLAGGQDGTVFGSLTVTGEDRVHIEFERPELAIELDSREAPGLEWGDPLGVLQRSGIHLEGPLLAHSAMPAAHGLADAWAREFRQDGVVRFRPNLEDVHRWRLEIVDSRSDTVAVFSGKGNPPEELVWNGDRHDGRLAEPGPTYSYVLIASDKAGNRRTFPGSGFELPPYRVEDDDVTAFLFAGTALPSCWVNRPSGPPPSLLLEAATRLSRDDRAKEPIEVRAVARSFAEARALGDAVAGALGSRVLGDPARIRVVTDVRTDAPVSGTIVITSPVEASEA